MLSRKQTGIFWLILVSQLCLLLVFVFVRLIDHDEGAYLSAARLVKQGKLPYLDFFYPQMPYLPYALALVSDCGFSSLFCARLISALAGLLLSVLLFSFVYRLSGDARLSLFLFFLYGFNGLTVNWHCVAKTLVFSDLFGFLSFSCFAYYLLSGGSTKRRLIFLAGLLMGVAFNFRLVFLPLLLTEALLVLWLSTERRVKDRLLDAVLLFCGAVLASLLAISLLVRDPHAFVFGNVGYHLKWGGEVIRMAFMRKAYTLAEFVFYPQNLLILTLGGIGLVILIRKLRGAGLDSRERVIIAALLCCLVLLFICFLMSPTQLQYYEQALPYVLISSIPALSKINPRWLEKKALVGTISVFYLVFLIPFIVIFLFVSREKDGPYAISEVKSVTKVVSANSRRGDTVLSDWPAYQVLSNREATPGMETWGWELISFLSSEQNERFRLADNLRIRREISSRRPGLIVVGVWFLPQFEDLIEANYRLLESTRFAKVYVRGS
jgi:4-amino-4-deoxy-L-arabinose transferase-like glycosyltransferase